MVRKLKNDGAKYYGPYMIGVTSRDILELIYSVFPIRECKLDFSKISKSHRPCLNYHIGRCKAPCANKISKEEYSHIIDDVISFLNGNDKKASQILMQKMKDCSDNLDFELALHYKQKLETLNKLIRKQVTALPKDFDLDIFSIASNGYNTVVAVLFVRGGKLVGGDKQIIEDYMNDQRSALGNYIMQYYDIVKYIPQEIITATDIDDTEIISQYLSQTKGAKVNIITPIMGVRRQLADMSQNNASDYLEKSLSLDERKDNMTVGAVMQLQEYLRLENAPLRMECYDISHISGTDKVASMVVMRNGEPLRSHYRKFKINTVEGNNDFASLQETLERRLKRMLDKNETDESFASKPDLFVIDGGKGQLSSVLEIFEKYGCQNMQIISLAERDEEIFVPHNNQPIVLPKSSYALKMLQRLRDEAHRFAITFHRDLRKKRQTSSKLLNIEGVGEKRAKLLMETFRTIENIKNASVEELLLVNGIDKTTAQNIKSFFDTTTK